MALVYERETFGKCPACGGDILEGEKNYYCAEYKKTQDGGKECKVHLAKVIMGNGFGKEEAREFFEKMKTESMTGTTQAGKEVVFFLEYDGERKEIVPRYVNEKQEPLGKCPKCGEGIFTGKKNYFCGGYKKEEPCTFILWKKEGGAEFTQEMVKELLAGKELESVPCFTVDGKEYKASFRLKENGDLVKKSIGG